MITSIYPLRLRFSHSLVGRSGHYLGSAWRGSFGHALKKLVCIFKQGQCGNCPLTANCAYTCVFDAETTAAGIAAAPYTLYPVIEAGEMCIYLTLFGERAAGFFPFILHALRSAGEQQVAHTTFSFEAVERFDGQCWRELAAQPASLECIPAFPGEALLIQLHTPVRFKYQGHLVTPEVLSFKIWINALRRRLISLATLYGDSAAMRRLCDVEIKDGWQKSSFRWQDLERYSSRQKTAMKMGGVTGSFIISSEQAEPLWPMLWLGQWTHIGKISTMGLGRYQILPHIQEAEG